MDLYNPSDVFAYISELSIDDIDSLQYYAHNRDDILSDEELAMALFAEEAEGLLNIAKDRVGQAIGRASTMIEELEEMEAAARYDRLVALAISEGREIPPRPRPIPPSRTSLLEPDSDSESSGASSSSSDADRTERDEQTSPVSLRSFLNLMSTGQFLGGSAKDAPVPTELEEEDEDEDGDEDEDEEDRENVEQEEEQTRETEGAGTEQQLIQQCTVCGDDIDGTVYKAPCDHVFDMGCLEAMFRKASVDESLFPPRCCQLVIPISAAETYLSHNVVTLFNKKAMEFNTPSRIYCHKPKCSAFIGPTTSEPTVLCCPECPAATCGFCRAEAHEGKECSDTDDLNNMAKDMKEKEGWQRCPECHHMVELTIGCYHFICVCSAQFCYLCASQWKECSCPQFAVPEDLE